MNTGSEEQKDVGKEPPTPTCSESLRAVTLLPIHFMHVTYSFED